MVTESVVVTLEVFDKASGKFNNFSRTIKEIDTTTNRITSTFHKFNTQNQRWETQFKKTTEGLERFKFELLSVMFFGMALDRVFGGLLQRQFQLFGITELFSSVLTVMLLPIMNLLLPLFLKLADFLFNLPEGVQLAIGVFVLFGAILGKFLFIFGTLGLGIQGLIKTFPFLGGVIKAVQGIFTGLGSTAILVVGIIIALVLGMIDAWRKNFLGMKRVVEDFVSGVRRIFNGVITFFKGIFNLIKGIFTGNFDLAAKGVKQIFVGLFNFITGILKTIGSAITAIFIGALNVVRRVLEFIIKGIGFLFSKIPGLKNIGESVSRFGGVIGSFQTGGIVPQTGPFLLHKGEQVIPTNKVGKEGEINFMPTININASVNNDIDMRRLSEEINRRLATEFERIINTRSSI